MENTLFKETHGTVFHGTKKPLQKWFLIISLILNVKKGLSSYQLQRDLDLNQKMAWYILKRIRSEMSKKGGALPQSIIEADEILSAFGRCLSTSLFWYDLV